MKHQGIIEATTQWVREQLWNEHTGHDWHHIERVTKTAKALALKEHADLVVVTLSALVHDLADDKVVENEEDGLQAIKAWFSEKKLDKETIDHILSIITSMSFKGGNGEPMATIEGQVVQDADRLDALGAVGIARTFIYSGSKGQPMYDPSLPTRESMTLDEYRNGKSSAIHHFHEKLLKLKDLMNTDAGRSLAKERHQFMEQFLDQFYNEWNGN
ncbi:HD domain-containing protein [Alkalihalophilus sp. As8PL]|uniref:HD domain-containing protein n=1 Tax=Alkalihalophilus sp. As8PL TaxID=3237103 RepID=A0AB39BRK2_9BACI